jgi:hypothetical protein
MLSDQSPGFVMRANCFDCFSVSPVTVFFYFSSAFLPLTTVDFALRLDFTTVRYVVFLDLDVVSSHSRVVGFGWNFSILKFLKYCVT